MDFQFQHTHTQTHNVGIWNFVWRCNVVTCLTYIEKLYRSRIERISVFWCGRDGTLSLIQLPNHQHMLHPSTWWFAYGEISAMEIEAFGGTAFSIKRNEAYIWFASFFFVHTLALKLSALFAQASHFDSVILAVFLYLQPHPMAHALFVHLKEANRRQQQHYNITFKTENSLRNSPFTQKNPQWRWCCRFFLLQTFSLFSFWYVRFFCLFLLLLLLLSL